MSSDIAMEFSVGSAMARSVGIRRYLPMILTVLVILLLAYELAGLTWRWFLPSTQPQVLPPPALDAAQSGVRKSDVTRIVSAHLFGKAEATPADRQEVIFAPETRLSLELRGVFATGDDTGAAIIADASRQEHYYRIGETVAGDARLHEVHPDRVILERAGRYEALSLPSEPGADMVQPQGRSAAAVPAVSPGQAINNPETGSMLRQYRETLVSEPQQLMNLVRLTPVTSGSQTIGYRITPGADRTLLARFGLRSGDVVTAVNGLAVDNPSGGLDIIQKLASAEQLVLQIERDGVAQTFVYQVNE